jgi:AraC family transcriptional regulator
MEVITIPGGLYATFVHKGHPAMAASLFSHIYGTWLPASGFMLDNRPHVGVMGERYKNNDPDSEETFWIPVKPKGAD